MKKPEFNLPPLLKKLKRGGSAITLPKDAGMIIAYSGIGKESRVLELGSGSGFMTVQMANVAKEVISYEKREEFQELAKSNVKRSGLENVTFKFGDVLKDVDEEPESFDMVFCDIAEADQELVKSHAIPIGELCCRDALLDERLTVELHLQSPLAFGLRAAH